MRRCWLTNAVEAVYWAVMQAAKVVLMILAFFAALFLLFVFFGGLVGGVWFLLAHWKVL